MEFHNAILVGEPEGEQLNLAVTFTNPGEATVPEVRVDEQAQLIRVAEGVTTYGFAEQQLVFPAPDDMTFGEHQNVSFQADGAEPVGVEVQLISSEFHGYETLAPVESATP